MARQAQIKTASRVPELQGENGYDHMTGGVAPKGRQQVVRDGGFVFGQGGQLTSKYEAIEEIADMWTPGNPNGGLSCNVHGRVLPNILPVRCVIPLTDVTGARLDESPASLELARRSWYAEQMLTANRLTPVHHILGVSDIAWHDGISETEQAQYDEWRAMLWEPEHMRRLMATYRDIYTIDWSKLAIDKIIAPLESRKRREERRGHSSKDALAIKVQRARSEIKIIQDIARAVQADDMTTAAKHHALLAKVAVVYNEKISPYERFVGGILGE